MGMSGQAAAGLGEAVHAAASDWFSAKPSQRFQYKYEDFRDVSAPFVLLITNKRARILHSSSNSVMRTYEIRESHYASGQGEVVEGERDAYCCGTGRSAATVDSSVTWQAKLRDEAGDKLIDASEDRAVLTLTMPRSKSGWCVLCKSDIAATLARRALNRASGGDAARTMQRMDESAFMDVLGDQGGSAGSDGNSVQDAGGNPSNGFGAVRKGYVELPPGLPWPLGTATRETNVLRHLDRFSEIPDAPGFSVASSTHPQAMAADYIAMQRVLRSAGARTSQSARIASRLAFLRS